MSPFVFSNWLRNLPTLPLLCALLMAACTTVVPDDGTMHHARWLTMTDSTATVLNPWRPGEVLHTYSLPAENQSAKANCENQSAKANCENQSAKDKSEGYTRAVSATSLHAYLAYRLGALDRLAGVMDADYIVARELRHALEGRAAEAPPLPAVNGREFLADMGSSQSTIADMGSSQSPNLERIKAAGCDLIFASPFENAGYGALETLGIPIVECADYMETTPLGRAEWMRFYGRLLGRAAQADSLYAAEEAAYYTLCTRGQSATAPSTLRRTAESASPTVLLGKREGQAWYVPGGRSYLGTLLDDADTHYIFAEESSTGSVPLDFEAVYARAKDADLWFITYAAPAAEDGTFAPMTYDALAAEDERYAQFRAFREHHIWACNTLEVPYYDALPWSPATLLREILAIARPDRVPDYKPHYFRPLR